METGEVIFTVGMPGVVPKKREWFSMLDYPKKKEKRKGLWVKKRLG